MKDEVFYGKGIHELEGEYPDLYDLVKNISEVVYDGHTLDYKTQKLIAIGITASRADPRATKKQIKSGMQELDITKEEIMDVLKVIIKQYTKFYNKTFCELILGAEEEEELVLKYNYAPNRDYHP